MYLGKYILAPHEFYVRNVDHSWSESLQNTMQKLPISTQHTTERLSRFCSFKQFKFSVFRSAGTAQKLRSTLLVVNYQGKLWRFPFFWQQHFKPNIELSKQTSKFSDNSAHFQNHEYVQYSVVDRQVFKQRNGRLNHRIKFAYDMNILFTIRLSRRTWVVG